MTPKKDTAILLIHCPDQPGLVRAIAQFLADNGGNILHFDQHVDAQENVFFTRVEWQMEGFALSRGELPNVFGALALKFAMRWALHFSADPHRVAILCSKESHCLYDLLARQESGDLPMEVPLIISNHEILRPAAERFGIPFHHVPVTKEGKAEAEARQVELIEAAGAETIVLARYMQILSEGLVARYPGRVINIHHSFLPAFPGARPYHSAFQRGVKIIGATSHYVTADLDEGPIIEQDVIRVSHKLAVEDFVRNGRDLEKVVLSRALRWHLERKILSYNNKTVVFA
ncbi:MAG: formyltetrahydrofolate deformylase [Verrucomicrobiales bacterium]